MLLDHYEIKVGEPNIYGNFIPVRIIWYVKGSSSPVPSYREQDVIFVTMPNLIARIRNISLEDKIEIAKKKLTRQAERHLSKNIVMQLLCK